MNLASEKQLAEMKEWMSREQYDADEKIAFFINIYNELGVKEICEKRIEALFAKCDEYINNISVSEEKKMNLKNFANSLLNRKL